MMTAALACKPLQCMIADADASTTGDTIACRAMADDAQLRDAILSVDTFQAEVAAEAVRAGASMVNDVSGGRLDPHMHAEVGDVVGFTANFAMVPEVNVRMSSAIKLCFAMADTEADLVRKYIR